MSLTDKLFLTEIPESDQKYVDLFRKSLRDYAPLNKLEQVQESTDIQLYYSLINAALSFSIEGFYVEIKEFTDLPWTILQLGATLNLLNEIGILSARNTLTYQDPGGVTVQDYDKYGRYINYFNILTNRYAQLSRNWRSARNIDNCYGGIASEFSLRQIW